MGRESTRRWTAGISSVIFATVIVFLFQQCSPYETSQSENTGPSNARAVDQFQEPRPAVVCGRAGFEFMYRNYIKRQCGSCHTQSIGLPPTIHFPLFTSDDLNVAYSEALSVSKARWHETSTENKFCGPPCSLTPGGDMHVALMEWGDYPVNCP